MTEKETASKEEFSFSCHCGRVQGKFWSDPNRLVAWDCDCSDCNMRRNTHIVVPKEYFRLDMEESLDEATTLYLWGTKTAQRRFCKTCGILPFYQPRSNPDGYGVTIWCVDWSKGGKLNPPPKLTINKFDGVNWEDTIRMMREGTATASILDESKTD